VLAVASGLNGELWLCAAAYIAGFRNPTRCPRAESMTAVDALN
jgi:hypothetical protein